MILPFNSISFCRKINSAFRHFFLFPLALLALFHSPIVQAEIESISAERLSQGDSQSYWQVDVTCKGESESIAIRQQGAQSNWCTDSDPVETCEDSKEVLADKICNTALLSILRPSGRGQASTARQATVTTATTAPSAQATEADIDIDAARERERLQQAKFEREAETNRIRGEQARLRQERSALEREKQDLRNSELDLARQLKEVKEKIAQLK